MARIIRARWLGFGRVILVLGLLTGVVFAGWTDMPHVEGVYRIQHPIEARGDWDALRPAGDRIRIASYNIQDFTDAISDGPNRTPERMVRQAQLVAELIREIAPDILVMQEIENPDSLNILNDAMPEPYPLAYITRFSDGGNRELNIAVLSRVALTGLRELDFGKLRGPGRPPRGILSFVLNLDDQHRLLVYGVHLKANWGERDRNIAKRFHALRLVAEDAQRIRERYPAYTWQMMVLGDVNVDPDSEEFADDPSLKPLNDWRDLWRGKSLEERATIPTRYGDPSMEFPPAAFDRFFISPELEASPWIVGDPGVIQRGVDTQNVFVVGGENELHASDHYPVFVDLIR
jgi:endonuclease/exonuclease/phosphatase family metal-dependent hydrolase